MIDNEYKDSKTLWHRLSGSTKIVVLITGISLGLIIKDIRILFFLLLFWILCCLWARIAGKILIVSALFAGTLTLINAIMIIFLAPRVGQEVVGTSTVLFHFIVDVRIETIMYAVLQMIRFMSFIPIGLLFFFTTNPTRFAYGLTRIGVSYPIAYSVSIALRYIPDINKERIQITQAMLLRGISIGKDEKSIKKRIKNVVLIIMPLLSSAFQHIDNITIAMSLRGFGVGKNRTWYSSHKFTLEDKIVVLVSAILLIGTIILRFVFGYFQFWYPF